MQVIILEYVVPRVLEYPCVKFDRVSVLTGVWTRSDISGLRARHIRPSRTVHFAKCQFLMGSSYGFYILFLFSTHALYSLMFGVLDGNGSW
jgi:hypothetical protein